MTTQDLSSKNFLCHSAGVTAIHFQTLKDNINFKHISYEDAITSSDKDPKNPCESILSVKQSEAKLHRSSTTQSDDTEAMQRSI